MNELHSRDTVRRPAPFRRAMARARCGWRSIVVLPPLCPSCREPLGDGVGLCAACWSKLSFIEPPYCERLGIPFLYDPGPGLLSMEAIADPPAYRPAPAPRCATTTSPARWCTRFKYGDRLDLAPLMGRWMARAGRELLAEADALIPVPLHWRRLWARRFNQSAALAAAIAQRQRRPGRCTAALKRVQATAQQVGLSQARARATTCRARSACRRGKQGRCRRPPRCC